LCVFDVCKDECRFCVCIDFVLGLMCFMVLFGMGVVLCWFFGFVLCGWCEDSDM
jgi:hypothetical protein